MYKVNPILTLYIISRFSIYFFFLILDFFFIFFAWNKSSVWGETSTIEDLFPMNKSQIFDWKLPVLSGSVISGTEENESIKPFIQNVM